MSSKPIISVIIPVAGKWELTHNCLQSLHQHSQEHDLEVIVVDNASTDETASVLPDFGASLFGERFIHIRNGINRNFGPASNQGARSASAKLLLFLNNDTLLTPNWLPPLLAALNDEPALGAVGPLLLYPDDTVQHLGVAYCSGGVSHLYQKYPRAHPLVTKTRYVQILTAAALLMPRRIFWEAGSFYEGYINGFEDVDLCVQVGQKGHKLRCVSESAIYHLESQTPGRFANEAHNSAIGIARFVTMMRPDLHLHAVADGMKPVLNDALGMDVLVSEQSSLELLKAGRALPIPELMNLISSNPGWLEGVTLLRTRAEKAGERKLALHMGVMGVKRHMTLASLQDILHLADPQEKIVLRKKLQSIQKLYTGPEPAIMTMYEQSKALYEHWGDTIMPPIFEAKRDFIDKTIARINGATL